MTPEQKRVVAALLDLWDACCENRHWRECECEVCEKFNAAGEMPAAVFEQLREMAKD